METLHDLFEASVKKNLMNTAIVWKDSNISFVTYDRLQKQASDISEFLSETYSEGGFVGILMDRVPLLPCVVLGVLRQRLAFAFIDEKSSYQWNINLVRKLNICWIISLSQSSQTELLQKHATLTKSIIVCGSRIDLWNVVSKIMLTTPKMYSKFNYAYAVQTSGTTGQPKIVKVPHKCIIPNILDFGHVLSVQTSDVILLGTALTFDPSVVELFLALANGATLALPTAYEVATVMQTTPSLLTTLWKWKLMPRLRCLVLGGEPCPSPSVLAQHLSLLPSRPTVFSAYGITEVSCWASLQCVDLDAAEAVAVPLGNSLSETLMEIRDEQGTVLTTGEGHLYIGSSLRVCIVDDELEENLPAAVFRPTGDIVKVCPTGLWYLGRQDRMVKRWGHRLDLQLVETTAARLTHGATCCAVVMDTILVLAVSEYADCFQLRKQLMDHLPVAHIPDAVVKLKEFPLTKHGKVDLSSVRSHVVSLVQNTDDFREKNLEDILKRLWCELLNKEPSSGGFLEEGGSSILALQLFSLLELHLDYQVPASLLPALLSGKGATFRECLHILGNADCFTCITCEDVLPANQLYQYSPSVRAAASQVTGQSSEMLSSGTLIVPSVSTHQEQSTDSTGSPVSYQTAERFLLTQSHYKKLNTTGSDSQRMCDNNMPPLEKDHHDHYFPPHEDNSKSETKIYHSVEREHLVTVHDEKIFHKVDETEIIQAELGKIADFACSSSVSKMTQTLERKDSVSNKVVCASGETVMCDKTINNMKYRAIAQYSTRKDLENEQLFKDCEERELMSKQNRQLTEKLSSVCRNDEEHNILWCTKKCSLNLEKDSALFSGCQGRTIKYSAVEQHAGHWNISSNIRLSLMLKLYLNKCVDASPCVASYKRHSVYLVGSHSGQLAIIHDDGKVHSILQLTSRIEAPVCLSPCGQQAYVGCSDGNVYAVDITHGSIIWVFSAGDKVKGAPVLCCERTAIAIGSYNQKLYCVKLQDGSLLWSCELDRGSICASPCVNSCVGLIFVTTLDGTVAALQETSGQIVWQHHLSVPIFSSPVSFHHSECTVVVVADVLGKVHCYSTSKGNELWTFQAAGNIFSSLCFFESDHVLDEDSDDETNYGGTCLLFGCHDQKVYSLASNGQLLWTSKLDSAVYATPFAFSTEDSKVDFVAVASTSGTLCILHANSGELLYSKNLGCEVFSSPAVCGGVLVIGARDNYLYSFRLMEA